MNNLSKNAENGFDEELVKIRELLSIIKNQEEIRDIQELIQDFESLKLIKTDENHTRRRKRQANSCASLQEDIKMMNTEIADLQSTITSMNSKIVIYDQKIASYDSKFQRTQIKSFSALSKAFSSLKNSTVNAINAKKATIVELENGKVSLEAQIGVACAATTTTASTTTAPKASSSSIFFCYWTGYSSASSKPDPSYCSHLSYAFINFADSNGKLFDKYNNLGAFKNFRNTHPNVKLLISIGGWNEIDTPIFAQIAKSSSLRQTFANNVLNMIQSNNLHGGKYTTYFINHKQ